MTNPISGDPAPTTIDVIEGRKGHWMQTSLGGKFFPCDPRVEDIHISDIANGLALDCRYAGQGAVDRFYSVAEHCWHMTYWAARQKPPWPPEALMVCLLHDASEAYINDLPRAVKHAVNGSYTDLEDNIQGVVWERYNLVDAAALWAADVKAADRRIVPLEKVAIMRHPQPWAHDVFEPLEDVTIHCWPAKAAKRAFLDMYRALCLYDKWEIEHYEI